MAWFRPTSTRPLRLRFVSAREERPSRRLRNRLVMVALVVPALVLVARRADLSATIDVMGRVTVVPFLVALGLAAAGVVNRAGQFRSAHRLAGLDTDLRSMARVSAAGYAVNKVVKTGGLGGAALFVRHGRHRGHPPGGVLAACLLSSVSGQLALLTIAGIALGSLAATGHASGSWLLAGATLALVLLVVVPTLGLAALRSRETVHRWYPRPFVAADRWLSRIGLRGPATPDPTNVDRFFEAIATVRARPLASLPVLAHALAAKVIGAGVLTAALAAVGADIGPGTALLVYVMALVAAAGTVLPGGIGAVEATMTVLLARAGVPAPTALAGTITFRFLDLWLPIAVGLVLAPGLERAADTDRSLVLEPEGRDRPSPVRHGTQPPGELGDRRPDEQGAGTCDRPSTMPPVTIGGSPSLPSPRPWGPTYAALAATVSTLRRSTTSPSPRSSGPCTTTVCWCSGISGCPTVTTTP